MNKYEISVQTPLGLMHGSMLAEIAGDTVQGKLRLMGYTQPFEGSAEPDGTCRIFGTVSTLLWSFDYTATGKILPDQVTMEVRSGNGVFQLVGTAVNP